MIENDDHLNQTRAALANMEDALSGLMRAVPPSVNPVYFALRAEPILDYIRDLRREIDDYIGLTFAIEQQSQPEIARVLDGTAFGEPEPSPAEWPPHAIPQPTPNARV